MQEFVHDHVSSPQNPVAAPDTTYEMFVELARENTEYVFERQTQWIPNTQLIRTVCRSSLPHLRTRYRCSTKLITPNGDNVNDEFIIQYISMSTKILVR
jgi:uncharacterized protein YifN (PemK superfamily)